MGILSIERDGSPTYILYVPMRTVLFVKGGSQTYMLHMLKKTMSFAKDGLLTVVFHTPMRTLEFITNDWPLNELYILCTTLEFVSGIRPNDILNMFEKRNEFQKCIWRNVKHIFLDPDMLIYTTWDTWILMASIVGQFFGSKNGFLFLFLCNSKFSSCCEHGKFPNLQDPPHNL